MLNKTNVKISSSLFNEVDCNFKEGKIGINSSYLKNTDIYFIETIVNLIDVDGVRVQFTDGWALVRASNTGPNLTIRYEADSEENLKTIRLEMDTLINNLLKEVGE